MALCDGSPPRSAAAALASTSPCPTEDSQPGISELERYHRLTETLGIAGSGTIAVGLAAIGSTTADVILWARSPSSAERARAAVDKTCSKLGESGADAARVRVTTEIDDLREASYLVEAIAEDHGSKAMMLADLGELSRHAGVRAIIATTTSSLSVAELAVASGHPERFVGLHVFNPVPRMELVELVYPPQADEGTRTRTRQLCEDLGKTAVEVPDTPGFVVNRLLFPYLFDAVNFMVESGLTPEAVDTCMTLGAGLPMGPIALLDFIGLDVSKAIGESIGLVTPDALEERVSADTLGRKTGRGFYDYS
jgi:3-hydroxybutyryl-CoA dehydrogenase